MPTATDTLRKFKCNDCKTVFDAPGAKVEYNSPIYGPTVSYRAECTGCGAESMEYVNPDKVKAGSNNIPPCGNDCGNACSYMN